MDRQTSNDGASPLPPPHPPPLSGIPHISPTAPVRSPTDSLRRSLRMSPTDPFAQPPRPRLDRIHSSSRGNGNFQGRFGRERLNSSHSSHHDQDIGDLRSSMQRRGSQRPQPQVSFGEEKIMAGNQLSMSTDRRLLIASLDHEALEDEAESTLLEVLERRQVAIDTHDHVAPSGHRRNRSSYLPSFDLLNLGSASDQRPVSAPSSSDAAKILPKPYHVAPSGHRRNRSSYLPSIDMPNLGSASNQRPVSAPSSSEAAQILPKPSLHQGRNVSHGLRSSLRGPQPSLDGNTGSADWALDSQGGLLQIFPESTDQLEGIGANANDPKEMINQASGHDMAERENPFWDDPRVPIRGNRHQRRRSVLPLGFERVISDSSRSSGPSGLTAPGERARHVALKMKSLAANNLEGGSRPNGEGDLTDLLNIMDAHRDHDNHSIESAQRSREKLSTNEGGPSNASGTRSAENNVFSSRQRPFSGVSSSPFSNDTGFTTNMDNLFHIAEHVQELHQIPEGEEEEDVVIKDSELAQSNANFLSQIAASHPDVPPVYPEETEQKPAGEIGGVNEQTPMLQQPNRPISPHKIEKPASGRINKIHLWLTELRKQMKNLAIAFDAPFVRERFWSFLQNSFSLHIMPALGISALFYYQLNNPFLPIGSTRASISWWILFVIRHYLTLQLANMTEYVFVDVLAMRTLLSVQLIGPLATLYTINAKGWPYIISWWGLFNLLLIQDGHGNPVFSHWLHFTGIEMFTPENPSGEIVESEIYRGILVSMVIAGVATSVKSTLVALYFGRRVFIHYKPKMEKVMENMILINEVADLGHAIDGFEFAPIHQDSAVHNDSKKLLLRDEIRTSTMNEIRQKSNWKKIESDSDKEVISDDESHNSSESSTQWTRHTPETHSFDDNNATMQETLRKAGEEFAGSPGQDALDKFGADFADDANDAWSAGTQGDLLTEKLPVIDNTDPPITTVHEPVQGLLRNKSTTNHIKSLLDEWEEPVNKQDKMDNPTIQDIILFRKAMLYFEDTHPFGSSFGPAFTRDSCIKSSKSLYKRLLSSSDGSSVLSFDVIGVLAYNEDGTFDDKKAKNLLRLFRPDKYDEISLLHFVQSCDGIYKKIRYLRASVGNSTLIDSVLEDIINVAFGFILALTVMSVLHLNPWALLVSLSTVLVSFAFALGPSAAKLIEGMIMIAVRRPFDLGDRISIVDCTGAPDNSGDPGYHDTWIVEDVNLFTTTLRLSRSNEISTVNNGAIANTRIVNHGRSNNALVNVSLPMRIEVTHENVQIVQSAIEQYIQDNPRVWSGLLNFRITKIDPANELIVYSARIQHVKSWQDLLPILQARGDLEKFCTEILIKLDIYYGGSSVVNNVYIKELPENDFFPQEAAHHVPLETDHQHND